ncbi:hypothetical protein PT106_08830, partial [Erysipelothrix rhusiopathiae]|nr:hypothetical protein [Erysipelothrix rhusiopathiae]
VPPHTTLTTMRSSATSSWYKGPAEKKVSERPFIPSIPTIETRQFRQFFEDVKSAARSKRNKIKKD